MLKIEGVTSDFIFNIKKKKRKIHHFTRKDRRKGIKKEEKTTP